MRWRSKHGWLGLLVGGVALGGTGCATRAGAFVAPPTAAAALEAPAAPPEPVALSLTHDVPLPGESTAGWSGLDEGDAPAPGPRAAADSGGAQNLEAADVQDLLARPLTTEAAVKIAVLRNESLKASLEMLGAWKGRVVEASTLPNPALELGFLTGGEAAERQGELRIEFDVTSAILAPLRTEVATSALEAERVKTAAEVLELGFQVRSAFFAVQEAEARLAIATRSLDAAAAARDTARALAAAGNVPTLAAATEDAAYEEARVAVAQLELERVERREKLRRLLGLHGTQAAFTLAAPLAEVPPALEIPADLESRAVAANLALEELDARVEGASRRTALARTTGWMPDVSLDLRSERAGALTSAGAGLRVTLPLFDRRQGARLSAEAEFDSLVHRHEALAIELRSAAREARARLEAAHAKARHFQTKVLPARKRVMSETLLQYDAMQVGVFQLLAARRAELDAQLSSLAATREFWTAAAALDALLAGHRVDAPATPATSLPVSGPAGHGGH